MSLTFGSLFAGIGGIDLGLERAGMTCKWQVEVDPFCQQVLAKHWPDVARYSDIKEIKDDELPPVDVVAGGFPCQGFSSAGKRLGTQDARWLWPEYARLLGVLRPRLVMVENVPELLTIERGGGLHKVLADLAALGYDAEWSVVSACAVGAPHARERLFLLAHSEDVDMSDQSAHCETARGLRVESGRSGSRAWRDWWLSEPEVGRVAHGIPNGLVRSPLHAYGNAVVPQVAEFVGRRIVGLAA